VKQRILFGRVARGGGRPVFVVPSFGRSCVCCNADANGRMQPCDPSTERMTAAPVQMPVCDACKDHAMQSAIAPRLHSLLVVLGIALVVGGAPGAIFGAHDRHDLVVWAMVALGVAMVMAGALGLRAMARRDRRDQIAGHHARLMFSVAYGRMLLDTSNEELARELIARNPTARVMPEPALWRLQRQRKMPAARVVRSREP
jgi:hypothetical protein